VPCDDEDIQKATEKRRKCRIAPSAALFAMIFSLSFILFSARAAGCAELP
jgi:hypothetical protein